VTNLSHRLMMQVLTSHFNITRREARSFIAERAF
jgi:ribosomal protein S4